MRPSPLSLLALVAVCFLAVSVAGDACGGNAYGTAGNFDFYVFAQSWSAQFCQAHRDWPGCSNPTNWMQSNLTLHGMWPNYNQPQSGHAWPQCCQSQYGSDIDPSVAKALLPEFQTYWPNEQDPSGGSLSNSLWNHEWGKHGTCSGLTQKAYFQTAMDIQLQIGTPSVLSNNVGGTIQLRDLQAAFKATGCTSGGACMAGFNCAKGYLSAVTTCWDQNFNRILCPSAVLGSQGGQCTQSTVNIRAF